MSSTASIAAVHAGPTGGSGLGLSIAKWIVEKHGGTIALDSRPDGVTELEIHLRLRESAACDPDGYSSEMV